MTRCLGLVPAVSLYVAQKLKTGSVSAAAAVSSRTTTGLACTTEPLFLPLGGSVLSRYAGSCARAGARTSS